MSAVEHKVVADPPLPAREVLSFERLGGWRGLVGWLLVRPSRRARDAENARRLWATSEQLTGVVFEIPTAESSLTMPETEEGHS